MRNPGRVSQYFSIISLVMAIIAFILGSAPFTPALILVAIAFPMALVTSFLGNWRVSIIAMYYSLAAIGAIPIAQSSGLRIDYILAIFGAIGLILGSTLYFIYARSKQIT
jgi:hypothetical protein